MFLCFKNWNPKNVSNKIAIWGLKFHIYTQKKKNSFFENKSDFWNSPKVIQTQI